MFDKEWKKERNKELKPDGKKNGAGTKTPFAQKEREQTKAQFAKKERGRNVQIVNPEERLNL